MNLAIRLNDKLILNGNDMIMLINPNDNRRGTPMGTFYKPVAKKIRRLSKSNK